jgi:sugar transferase (PEP-CTERM/EpsH1 system associated)
MIHVVHVVDSLAVGGMENGVTNLVNTLTEGIRHTVVTISASGALADRLPPHVERHCIGKRPGLDLGAILKLTRLLRRLRPSIVHSRNWGAFDAVVAARLAGVPAVIHGEHGREATDPDGLNRRRNRLRRLLAPLVSRFVTVSVDLRRWLVMTVKLPSAKVITIHNGVDVYRFAAGDRNAGRETLGLGSRAIVVGTVGRLDAVKDHAGLVEAWAALQAVRPEAELVIVGEGPCRSGLEHRIVELGLRGHVHLPGLSRAVPVLLRGFDVFVLPSLAEGISNTVLEAMATGLPVVATRVGGNPELVADGVTGTLVTPRDPLALAAAIGAYVNDPALRARHGDAGRRRVLEHFTVDHMAEAYRALYASLRPGSVSSVPQRRQTPPAIKQTRA